MVDIPMPLTAHLAELRARLMACVIAIAVGFGLSYAVSDQIVAVLQSPPTLVGEPVSGALRPSYWCWHPFSLCALVPRRN